MIQQGQVDRILQAKPEQIRELIEESAGTLVFKKRRVEAVAKLESTSANLSRLEDIENELVGQLKTLDEQAKNARTWKQLSDDLKQNDIEFTL